MPRVSVAFCGIVLSNTNDKLENYVKRVSVAFCGIVLSNLPIWKVKMLARLVSVAFCGIVLSNGGWELAQNASKSQSPSAESFSQTQTVKAGTTAKSVSVAFCGIVLSN